MAEQIDAIQCLGSARQRAQRLRQRMQEARRQSQQQGGGISAASLPSNNGATEATNLVGLRRPIPIRPTARVTSLHRPTPVRTSSWHPGAANVSNNRTASGRRMQSAKRLRRKYQKPSWYHQVAAKNRLGSVNEDAFAGEENESSTSASTPSVRASIRQAKEQLLQELNRTGGESYTAAFQASLQNLVQQYDSSSFDPRKPVPRYYASNSTSGGHFLEGVGIAAGKPTFPGCIGRNERGDSMYKLGTMSFGMFGPTQLVVSVQGTFVLIDTVDGRHPNGVKNVPDHLLPDVRFGRSRVRTYE